MICTRNTICHLCKHLPAMFMSLAGRDPEIRTGCNLILLERAPRPMALEREGSHYVT